jgi:SH3-like domain-containing protein
VTWRRMRDGEGDVKWVMENDQRRKNWAIKTNDWANETENEQGINKKMRKETEEKILDREKLR